MYVEVDGGRAKLPLPEKREIPAAVPEPDARLIDLLDSAIGSAVEAGSRRSDAAASARPS
jgi:hypothetical protein